MDLTDGDAEMAPEKMKVSSNSDRGWYSNPQCARVPYYPATVLIF